MKWYNPFSWGEKTADNILDKNDGLLAKVGSWIGNMNLTQEEVLEANAKTVDSVQQFVSATLSENTERSITRRNIAILWIKVELGLVLMCGICAPWNSELAEFYWRLASEGIMYIGTTAVIIFFFGSHGIAKIKSIKKQ